MVFKPATPGFLTTLTATILLAVVSFNVPYFKTIYFLQASYNSGGITGLINIGTLGYCISVNGEETCTHPSIGYEFDPNTLLGNTTRFQIPHVVTKWITYALFLHVIALALAAVSALFGLLAHVREFSMTCFSSCISGAAAFVCLIAFILDLVLFFLARARIREIDGATAVIGNAIWLTLAAWILLFISGCMFGIGRCCITSRPRGPTGKPNAGYGGGAGYGNQGLPAPAVDSAYAERMRMDAIKAEADRKTRQKAAEEAGLPVFDEYETEPLTAEDGAAGPPYRDQPTPGGHNRYGAAGAATGYAPAHSLPPTPSRPPSSSSVGGPGSAYRGPSPAIASGGRRPSDYNPAFPAASNTSYPPQTQQAAAGYAPRGARQASLVESNIYENAGIGAAAAAAGGAGAAVAAAAASSRNDYLRPANVASVHPSRSGSNGHHTQASSYYSAHSQYPSHYGGETYDNSTAGSYNNYRNQAYDQSGGYGGGVYHNQAQSGYHDPYQPSQAPPQQSAYSQYRQQTLSPPPSQYPPQRQASSDAYNKPLPYPGDHGGYHAQAASASGYQSPPGGYPLQATLQSGYPPPQQPQSLSHSAADLNFPGVPSPRVYASPTAINTQLPYGASAESSGQAPYTSPTGRTPLQPWREESGGPSTLVASGSRPVPEDAPPNYEPSDSSLGYRNEKATYRPTT